MITLKSNLMKKRILILDDDAGTLDVLTEALYYENFEVMATNDNSRFFEIIKEYKPDLVLLDYLLNGINGGEICHQLKRNFQSLPVIMMSAYPRVFLSLGTYGCNEFIPKPFDLFKLVDRIKYYVSAAWSGTKKKKKNDKLLT
ncbi:response regulator [Pedobacter sp. BS3]|nr:response regulator [Pedobacter sp. BS3]